MEAGECAMRSTIRIGTIFLLAAVLGGCASPAPVGAPAGAGNASSAGQATSSPGGPVRDQADLVEILRGRGVTAETSGTTEQPFLATTGTRLRLSGGAVTSTAMIESYEYDEAAAANADAGTIDGDGSPRTYRITWTAPPHFYRSERLIVLYVGADPAVTRLLTGVLGPQFAGR